MLENQRCVPSGIRMHYGILSHKHCVHAEYSNKNCTSLYLSSYLTEKSELRKCRMLGRLCNGRGAGLLGADNGSEKIFMMVDDTPVFEMSIYIFKYSHLVLS